MNKKSIIIASVLAALGVGVSVNEAVNSAASSNQISQREASDIVREASLDAATILKLVGLNKQQAEDELVASSNADRQSMKNITQATFNKAQERDAATIRSISMTIFSDINDTNFFKQYANSLCSPIKGNQVRAIYTKCVDDNDDVQGVKICSGITPKYNMIRMQVTPLQFERFQRLQGAIVIRDDYQPYLDSVGLQQCPELP